MGLAARLAVGAGGLVLVGAMAVGGPAVAPAGGQILTLPTPPTTSSSTPSSAVDTTLPATTAPAPTITVATVPTTRPPTTAPSSTAPADGTSSTSTSSTGVPTTPPPITTTLPPLPDTTPEPIPVDLSVAGEASYPWTPVLLTLGGFGTFVAMLATPVVIDRVRHRNPGRLRAALSAGTDLDVDDDPTLPVPVAGARRATLPRGARRAGAPPGPDAGRSLPASPRRPARKSAPVAAKAVKAVKAAKNAASRPPAPPPPAAGPDAPTKPAKPAKPAKAKPARPPKPPRPARPAPPPAVERSPWPDIEGRVPSDDPLAERPEDHTPRQPRRRSKPD